MGLDQKEFSALLSLLDDPDKEVHSHVVNKLMSLGTEIIPNLESAWENSFNPVLQTKIEQLIHKIQFGNIVNELKNWSDNDSKNLLKGALIVARYQYPDLDEKKLTAALEQIKKDIWIELGNNLTPLEQINVFNHVFYSIYKYSGNTAHINDPQNCYINIVLENKKGNPVSLGIIYLILAQQLELPVYGVNLPQHFILTYCKTPIDENISPQEIKAGTLFYINPFNKGLVFTRNEINLFLKKLNLEPNDTYYMPCSNQHIIAEMLHILIRSYQELGSLDKVSELRDLLSCVRQ